ncbi:MAG TPA: metalloprotease PmbA [Candidatus Saccharimonadia bacterium]|nr:metalloprotease PmbA [Candidatus Saccharimonadia bacterium]
MNALLKHEDDHSRDQLDELAARAEEILAGCRRAGASEAEVGLSVDRGIDVTVRLGEVETVVHTRDRGVSVTVYFGGRKGSANTADLAHDSIAATIEHACAIARHTEPDPCAGLADASRQAREFPDLDLWHPWDLKAERAIELGIACEAAGRESEPRISNSDGAQVSSSASLSIYANTNGFVGRERGTRHMVSCSLVGEDEQGMQRDYWYSSVRAPSDLEDVEAIGRHAAARTAARLGARALSTRECPVLFIPEVARGLIGHFVSAVSGGSIYRRASFLLDQVGQQVFPDWMQIVERPHLKRGQGSSTFDAEGVATIESPLVTDGRLARYVLGSYSARKLGLESTGNAGGVHNLEVGTGGKSLRELMREMHTGFVVTEVLGQGVNIVSGDYSRGAAGYWVENGELAHPVEEVTIASNLKSMLRNIRAVGADVDVRSHILTGSILVDRMTVAGG